MMQAVELDLRPTYSLDLDLEGEEGVLTLSLANDAIAIDLVPALRGQRGDPGDPGVPGDPGPPGFGVPAGGATGQILAKASSADGDDQWVDAPNSAVWGQITGDINDQTDLQEALAAAGPVKSVNTQTGDVVLSASDVGADASGMAADALSAALSADITDHGGLTDIGTNTHAQIDTALGRLANTSGTNTGDQDLSGKQDALGFTPVPDTRTVNGEALNADITVPAGPVVSETAPLSPWDGLQWLETPTGIVWTWYVDVDSSQWVEFAGSSSDRGGVDQLVDGASITLDLSSMAKVYQLTTVNDPVIGFAGGTSDMTGQTFFLDVIQGAGGSHAPDLSAFSFSDDVPSVTFSTVAGKRDLVGLTVRYPDVLVTSFSRGYST